MAEQLTNIITYRAAIIAKLLYASLHFTMILMNKMYYWNYFENEYLNSSLGTDRPTDRPTDWPTLLPIELLSQLNYCHASLQSTMILIYYWNCANCTIFTRGYGQTDRSTDLPTDIATYRAAIAAKNEIILKVWPQSWIFN